MLADGPLLLEREPELAQLDDAIAAVHGGEAPLVVVRGVAGIGKTSLLDAAAVRAHRPGITVLAPRGQVIGDCAGPACPLTAATAAHYCALDAGARARHRDR